MYLAGNWGGTAQNEKRKLSVGKYTLIAKDININYRFGVAIYYGTEAVITIDRMSGKNYSQKEFTEEKYISNVYISIIGGVTFNNETFEIMLLEGEYTDKDAPKYEEYGAMPSPEFPSEVETVGSNVNLFDKDNANILDAYINGTNGKIEKGNMSSIYIKCQANTTYTVSKIVSSRFIVGSTTEMPAENVVCTTYKRNDTATSITIDTTENDKYLVVYILDNKNTDTLKEILDSIKIEKGSVATPYSPYGMGSVEIDIANNDSTKSQTAIMPIQQEMLEGDYVSNVEHHEWGKVVFTGEENWNMLYGAGMFHITNLIRVKDINSRTSISNYFKYNIANNGIYTNLKDGEFAVQYYEGNTTLYIKYLSISTVEEFKTWLKSKYEAGTPVIVYYKLATPVDLELTSEQKAVRDTKLYTYKNITNIAVSDELASIDVTYKKDLETEHNKLQNQINEIKQLLSTTETSVLLLDNLQKDVESEVE